jgi:hypothetical protein
MRKTLSLVLAVVMLLGLSTTAFAAGVADYVNLPGGRDVNTGNFFLSFGLPNVDEPTLSDYRDHRRAFNTIDISAGIVYVNGGSESRDRRFHLLQNSTTFNLNSRAQGNLILPHPFDGDGHTATGDPGGGSNLVYLMGHSIRSSTANTAVNATLGEAFFVDRNMVGRWDLDVTVSSSSTFRNVDIQYVNVNNINNPANPQGAPRVSNFSSADNRDLIAVVRFELQPQLHQVSRNRLSRDAVAITVGGRRVTNNNAELRITTSYGHLINDDENADGGDIIVGNTFRNATDQINIDSWRFRAFETRGSDSFMNRVEIFTENNGIIETRLLANRQYYVAMLYSNSDLILSVLEAYDLEDFRTLHWENLPANSTVGFDFDENFYVYTIKEGLGNNEVPGLEYLGRSRGGLRLATTYFFAERELDLVTISDLEPEPEFEDDDLFNPGTGPNAGDVNPNWNPGTGR